MSDVGEQPTLLEEIETLHRSLKDLEGIRDYVRIIQHGLSLRYVDILKTVKLSKFSLK
jgi:RAD50-interacting protein 1